MVAGIRHDAGAGPAAGLRPPPDADAHAMSISYKYADGGDGSPVRSGLLSPRRESERDRGYLAAYSRAREPKRDIGDDAPPSSRTSRSARGRRSRTRFASARPGARRPRRAHRAAQPPLLPRDPRARGHARTPLRPALALVLFDLDDFKAINERIGHLAGDSVLAESASRLLTVVRRLDVPCRVGGDEFAVILPESGIDQADQLYRRTQGAVSGRRAPLARLDLSAGVAELTPDDDANALFERADEALYRAKDAGKGAPSLGSSLTHEAGASGLSGR